MRTVAYICAILSAAASIFEVLISGGHGLELLAVAIAFLLVGAIAGRAGV